MVKRKKLPKKIDPIDIDRYIPREDLREKDKQSYSLPLTHYVGTHEYGKPDNHKTAWKIIAIAIVVVSIPIFIIPIVYSHDEIINKPILNHTTGQYYDHYVENSIPLFGVVYGNVMIMGGILILVFIPTFILLFKIEE